MNNELPKISDAELEVMKIIWTLGKVHADEIISNLNGKSAWSESTIKTLMRRLVDKGWLVTSKDGRRFLYSATTNQQQAMQIQANSLFSQICDRDKGQILLNLVGQSIISQADLWQIAKAVELKQVTAPEEVKCNCLANSNCD